MISLNTQGNTIHKLVHEYRPTEITVESDTKLLHIVKLSDTEYKISMCNIFLEIEDF